MQSANSVRLRRHWNMPNASTFLMPAVARILREHVGDGLGWADPFAGQNSPAEHTNDVNKAMPTDRHMDAVDFLRLFSDCSLKGVLLDPPYSARQALEMYKGHGQVKRMTPILAETARVVRVGGLVISFGWNSNGLGANRLFRLESVDLIAHGAQHNDTIVTVERKVSHQRKLF